MADQQLDDQPDEAPAATGLRARQEKARARAAAARNSRTESLPPPAHPRPATPGPVKPVTTSAADANPAASQTKAAAHSQPAGGAWAEPVENVAPNPCNKRDVSRYPRKIVELAKSITQNGQITPCAVVTAAAFIALFPEHKAKIGHAPYVQVPGARRRAAIVLAGKPSIDIILKDDLAASRMAFLEATAAENIDREDLNPIEQAHALEQMVAECGSARVLADRLGKTEGWVSQQRALLKLAPEVQAAMQLEDEEHRLTERQVRGWRKLDATVQLAKLAQWQRRVGLAEAEPDSVEVPAQRKPSPVATAWRRLGGDPVTVAARLRTELTTEEVRQLAEELLRDADSRATAN